MSKVIVIGALSIILVLLMVSVPWGGSGAMFSDVEICTGNTITAWVCGMPSDTVRYEYYNWYDNPIGWQILEGEMVENGGSIISVVQEEDDWMQRGTPPTGGASENHTFRYRLVVTVQNNKEQDAIWPYCNTHHPFTIRFWDSATLKYIDDTRDPLEYSAGTLSSVDCDPIPFCTSYYTSQGGGGDGNLWTREYFKIYINWRFVSDTLPIGSISGYKWSDCNEDGVWDGEEVGLADWEIKLSKMVGVDWEYQSSTTTGVDGEYSFTELGSGAFKLEEVLQTGWTQTYPTEGVHIFTLGAGEARTDVNFGNYLPATQDPISGYKFNDLDGDGVWDCFTDNFTDGNADGWTPVTGTWSVVSNEYVQSTTTDEWQRSVSGDNYGEFELTGKGKFIDGDGWVGLVFNHGTGFYAFSNVYDGRNIARLIKSITGTYPDVDWSVDTSFTPTPGEWYEYKVVVDGNTIECYINDILLITKTDSDLLPAGQVGFFSIKSQASFDDIKACEPALED
jgi:hypothetical protein